MEKAKILHFKVRVPQRSVNPWLDFILDFDDYTDNLDYKLNLKAPLTPYNLTLWFILSFWQ